MLALLDALIGENVNDKMVSSESIDGSDAQV